MKTIANGITLLLIASQAISGVWMETSREDFIKGIFNVGLYVTAAGQIKMPYCRDINKDGYIDIIISNGYNDTTYELNSYIYQGPDFQTAIQLFIPSAIANNVVDINNDGERDIVFSSWRNDSSFYTESFLYYGPDFLTYETLPTIGALGNSVADISNDGYLDIIFSNSRNDSTYNLYSYIYYGPDFLVINRDSLQTHGAFGNSVADVNGDGCLDIVFSNWSNDSTHNIPSYLYYGPNFITRKELPTHGATGNSIADINKDGNLDIIFCNWKDDSSFSIYSYIYYGPDFESRDSLPTHGAMEVTVAYVDSDSNLDLVFSNFKNDSTHNINSYIYYGPNFVTKLSLPTHGATGNTVADFNEDGYKDVLFCNYYNGSTRNIYSYIYYGEDFSSYDSLLTNGAELGTMLDLGDIYHRKSKGTYSSSIFNAQDAVKWDTISWLADTVEETAAEEEGTKIAIRTGNTELPDTTWSEWLQVINGSSIPDSLASQYIQYQAEFITDFKTMPYLDKIEIHYSEIGIEEEPVEVEPETLLIIDYCHNLGKTAEIHYTILRNRPVSVRIYDATGRVVKTLLNEIQPPGSYQIIWGGEDDSGSKIPSGIYFCRIEIPGEARAVKLIILQ